ncbi:MAG: hypothetical protein ACRCYS_19435 [Beijerinckiaceae bacterium]
MVDVSTWSETPASNTTVDSVNIGEGTTPPSNVNNALRSIMAGVRTFYELVITSYVSLTGAQTLTNKTLTSPAVNGATLDAATTVSDTGTIATASVGFRGLPQLTKTASYTLALTDNGKHISITTGGIVIPANASVACPIGYSVAIYNDSGSTQAITITSDTLRLGGTTSTGTRTLAIRGLATLVKVAATEWVATGHVS